MVPQKEFASPTVYKHDRTTALVLKEVSRVSLRHSDILINRIQVLTPYMYIYDLITFISFDLLSYLSYMITQP